MPDTCEVHADFRRMIAERIEIATSKMFTDQELQQLSRKCELSSAFNPMLRAMVVSIDTYMHVIVKERIVIHKSWPKDWLQAFKDRWFPAWALRRWPVERETLDIDRPIFLRACPHLFHDGRSTHLEWMSLGENSNA